MFDASMRDSQLVRQIKTRYRALASLMDERMRGQSAATEAQTYGWGGLSAVSDYPAGIKVPDQQFKALNLKLARFHGDWNYSLLPSASKT